MTSPVPPYGGVRNTPGDDLIGGLYNWLYVKTDLMALLGHNPGAIPHDPLMFEHHLSMLVEGQQTNALVLKHLGGWGAPNPSNTAKFIRIALEFWCDPIRDEDNYELNSNETIKRIQFIYEKFDRYMHRAAPLDDIDIYNTYRNSSDRVEWWGTVRTIDCVRQGEFSFYRVPEGDGLYVGSAVYGVTLA